MRPLILTFYKSGVRRRHRWRLVHRNGRKIAQTSQGSGFSRLIDCESNAILALSGEANTGMSTEVATNEPMLPGRPDVEVVYA